MIYPLKSMQPISYDYLSLKIKNNIDFKDSVFLVLVLLSFSVDVFYGESAIRELDQTLNNPFNAYNIVRGIILMILGVGVVIKFLLIPNKSVLLKTPQFCYFIYAIICLISSIYSTNFIISFVKGLEISTFALLILLYTRNIIFYGESAIDHIYKIWNIILIYFIIRLAFLLVGALINPSDSFGYYPNAYFPFQIMKSFGVNVASNTSGQLAATVGVVCIVRITNTLNKYKLKYFLILLMSTSVLFLAQARTSIIALFFCILIFMYIKKHYLFFFALLSILLLIILFDSKVIVEYLLRGQNTEQLYSLTGRIYLWDIAFKMITESPIWGYGYITGIRINFNNYFLTWEVSNIDNTIIETMIYVGIIGLLPLVIAVINSLRSIYNGYSKNKKYNLIYLEILLVYTILLFRTILGPTIHVVGYNTLIFLVVMLFAIFSTNYTTKKNTST